MRMNRRMVLLAAPMIMGFLLFYIVPFFLLHLLFGDRERIFTSICRREKLPRRAE